MKNRQVESMTRLEVGPFKVRVWRTEEPEKGEAAWSPDNFDLFVLADQLTANICMPWQVMTAFERMPRVAAVEVLDYRGCGIIAYPDWK